MRSAQIPILLAENERNDVFLIRRALAQANLLNPLHVVNDGVLAIQYLEGHGIYNDRAKYPLPFLLLLDLNMPRKGGFEVLEWVREQPALRFLPTVVLTSSRDTPDIDRAYELGANSYLVKPPEAESLAEMLLEISHSLLLPNWKGRFSSPAAA